MQKRGDFTKEHIRAFREKAGLTQEALAHDLRYSSASIISLWENGERMPPTRILKKLSDLLNCTIDDLLKDKAE